MEVLRMFVAVQAREGLMQSWESFRDVRGGEGLPCPGRRRIGGSPFGELREWLRGGLFQGEQFLDQLVGTCALCEGAQIRFPRLERFYEGGAGLVIWCDPEFTGGEQPKSSKGSVARHELCLHKDRKHGREEGRLLVFLSMTFQTRDSPFKQPTPRW